MTATPEHSQLPEDSKAGDVPEASLNSLESRDGLVTSRLVKPIILCDVKGTLLLSEDGRFSKPNQPLIDLLNNAQATGFEVRIVTGGHVPGSAWKDGQKLLQTTLDQEIIATVDRKQDVNARTYANVIVIIDDEPNDEYIAKVRQGNHEAKHFWPNKIEKLTQHLALIYPREAGGQRLIS